MAEEKKKKKRPTAKKRDLQNEKKPLINKSFKSQVRSSMRLFEAACKEQDKGAIKKTLNQVYSLMDKGVKRGIYKANKANRTKGKIAAKAAK